MAIPPRSPSELSPGLQAALLSHERSRSPLPALGHPAPGITMEKGSAEHETDLLGLLQPFCPPFIHQTGPSSKYFFTPSE